MIVRIVGGIGNQMFQYAMGLSASLRLGVDLKLDLRFIEDYSLHNGYELRDAFGICTPEATDRDLRDALGWRSNKNIIKLLGRSKGLFTGGGLYFEKDAGLSGEFSGIVKDGYYAGYWQSEKYFIDQEKKIRETFDFGDKLTDETRMLAKEICENKSVSIHVRRGDYITNPSAHKVHGICSLEYYKLAVRYMESKVVDPCFFIFSDDPDWAKNNLGFIKNAVFVGFGAYRRSYEDMFLMSRCGHNIIANSSFSWWGAWLNSSSSKIVVAPKEWFASRKLSSRNLVPSSWVRI